LFMRLPNTKDAEARQPRVTSAAGAEGISPALQGWTSQSGRVPSGTALMLRNSHFHQKKPTTRVLHGGYKTARALGLHFLEWIASIVLFIKQRNKYFLADSTGYGRVGHHVR